MKVSRDESFARFDAEAWLIGELGNPPRIVDGYSNYEIRKPLVRGEILNRGLADMPMVSKGKRQTYAQVFERVYGEPLQPAEGVKNEVLQQSS